MRVQSKSTMKRYSSPLNFLRFLLVQIDHMTALQAHIFKKSTFGDLLLQKTKKREGEDTSWRIKRREKKKREGG